MSQENVDAFKRGTAAFNRRDIEAALAGLDPNVEWYPALLSSVAGEQTVIRGHAGVRDWLRDVDEAFGETQAEFSDIRDLGDRLVAIGHLTGSGKTSGAPIESPLCYVVDFKNGKQIRVRTYLDPKDALKAAGLRD
jgi:ketosteroid isomerase-like protein